MKKCLLVLGSLLFLSLPVHATHEAEIAHRFCAAIAANIESFRDKYGEAIEIVVAMCSYIAQLEEAASNCNSAPIRYIVAKTPSPTKTMMVFRQYPLAKLDILEPMTPVGLEVRQDTGLLPAGNEVLHCGHITEPLLLGKNAEVKTRRVRLVCGQSEFIIVGLVF